MPGDLIILDGCTFCSTDVAGDVEPTEERGLFYQDVRHLGLWCVYVDGRPVKPLSSRAVDYFSARVVGAAGGDEATLAVTRDRFVSEGMHEDIEVVNASAERRKARLEIRYASDFADVMEAQEAGNGDGGGRLWQELGARSVTLWEEREGYRRGTVITFSRRGRVGRRKAVFDLDLPPHGRWSTCIDITPIVDGKRRPPLLRCDSFGKHPPKMRMSVFEWLADAPEVEGPGPVCRTYERSLYDLAALRIRPDETHVKHAMPGGGLPWFMTVFGRDSLIAAYEALPFQADLAQSALEVLAALQAEQWDNFRDAEPGKILHELRRGTLAALGEIPHSPYYGSHDSTLLWLIVLDEYERWTGDTALVRKLEPEARAALAWLEGPADLDGDGYLEYRKRSEGRNALDNQCWKDSKDSIVFPDGSLAEPPIGTCELQGYAYDARLRTARLAREVWGDDELAARLERDAAELRERFNRDFWSPQRRLYVLALDGEKRQVDTVVSNIGHLLWSGIVDERRAAAVARRLLDPRGLFSGWGVRSLSADEQPYNPLGYHRGTVWPHDTALAAEGLRRYGFREEAGKICEALFDAAAEFDHQLPEVFAGFSRDSAEMPVEYPDALKPQSWAAGAPLLCLRTLLGLDVVNGRLRSRPSVPKALGRIRLRGVKVRGKRVDVP